MERRPVLCSFKRIEGGSSYQKNLLRKIRLYILHSSAASLPSIRVPRPRKHPRVSRVALSARTCYLSYLINQSKTSVPLVSCSGFLSFSRLSFLVFWFCLLFFLLNQSIDKCFWFYSLRDVFGSVCYSSYLVNHHHEVYRGNL